MPLAFAPAATPRVSIVIPVYGKPLLTFTCLQSVHAHTPAGTFEVIVVDDASPEPVADALAPRDRRALRAQSATTSASSAAAIAAPSSRAASTSCCSTTTRSSPRAGSMRCCACSRCGRTPGSSARSSIYPDGRLAGSRRHRLARRLGVELRPRRRSRPARVQLSARGPTTFPARASRFRPRCSASSADSTRATRRRTTRIPTSRSPCARRAPGLLPAGRDDRAFRGADVRDRSGRRREAPPGGEPRGVPREVAGGAGDASKQRHACRARARPEREAARAVHRRLHAHARTRIPARCACWRCSS